MTHALVLEGTWEEVKAQADLLVRHSRGGRVKLILVDETGPADAPDHESGRRFFETASREEFLHALDRIAMMSRRLPVLPDAAFDRESIYEDRW